MKSIQDLFLLVFECIRSFERESSGKFALTLAVAALLSALCWFICAKWTYLWNKRFDARPLHHVFCGLASTLTFFFVLTFPSLAFLKPLADLTVLRWSAMLAAVAGNPFKGDAMLTRITLSKEELNRAARWDAETFLTARHEVFLAQKAGLEPGMPYSKSDWLGNGSSANYALNSNSASQNAASLRYLGARQGWALDADELHEQPRSNGSIIPIGGRLGEISSKVYAEEAISLFREMNPLLSRLVWPPSERISQNLIVNDIREFQRVKPGKIYDLSQATNIARQQVSLKLSERTPRVVTIGRWVLVGLFLVAQAVPFGLIGGAAYMDLKAYRSSGVSGRTSRITSPQLSGGGTSSRHRVSPRRR
jgi:hypothetical protein